MKRLLSGFMAAAAVAVMLMVSPISAFAATYTNSPEQIVCTPYGDLKTQVGLNWVTGKNGSASIVQVSPKTEADFSNAVQYIGEAGDIDNWRWHKVVADNLTPGTTYRYRVGDGSNWSAAREFTTAPAENPENGFTFLNLNDPQASSQAGYNAWTTSLNHAAAKFPGYSFLMHCGDHVDNGANEDQWQWYFEGADSVYSKTIVAGVTGNHDALSGNRYAYRFNYEMPTAAATTQGTYYSFDYANAHFIAINAQALSDTQQIDWIKYDYVKNAKKWNIVFIHNPLYTNASHYAEVNVRNTFNTILNDQLGADIIFAGHDHIYNRTYPILNNEPLTSSKKLTGQTVNQLTNVTLWDNPAGTVNQVNNCCGIKFYNVNANADTKWFYPVPPDNKAGAQPKTMTYAGITVTDNELVNSAYYTNGSNDTLIESSGIKKTAPQINPPRNVKRTFSGKYMTISWDEPEEQEGQTVQQYVVFDKNNAYTTKNKTYFVGATARKQISVAMSESVYNETDFVVKAIGQHSVSEAGVLEEAAQTTPVLLTAAAGEEKAVLSWSAPIGATAVEVRFSPDNGATWTAISAADSGIRLSNAVSAASTAVDVLGLTGGATYRFKLTVIGGENAGDSNVVTVTPVAAEAETNPGTSLWVKDVRENDGTVMKIVNGGIGAGAYITVLNNKKEQVSVRCVAVAYDTNGILCGIRLLPAKTLAAEEQGKIYFETPFDIAGAQSVGILAYVDSIDPLKPGAMPYMLYRDEP